MVWTGRVPSALVVAFLLFDGLIKLIPLPAVTDTMAQLGYPAGIERALGVLTLRDQRLRALLIVPSGVSR